MLDHTYCINIKRNNPDDCTYFKDQYTYIYSSLYYKIHVRLRFWPFENFYMPHMYIYSNCSRSLTINVGKWITAALMYSLGYVYGIYCDSLGKHLKAIFALTLYTLFKFYGFPLSFFENESYVCMGAVFPSILDIFSLYPFATSSFIFRVITWRRKLNIV